MILVISAVFPPEPIVSASITYDLVCALSETLKVRVLTPMPSRPFGFAFNNEHSENEKFEHIIVSSYTCSKSSLSGRMRESYSFGNYAARHIREIHRDVELIYVNAWPLLAQHLIVKEANKYGIPSVLHADDIYPESLSNKIPIFGNLIRLMLLPLDRAVLKKVSEIIAVSDNMKNTFIHTRGISAGKISIIQNWQNENEFIRYSNSRGSFPYDQSENKPFTFMYLGNIGPVAGVEFIIKSFGQANLNGAALIIAGTGSMKEECVRLASRYSHANIRFRDVPPGKVPEIQAQADVMLLPVKRGAAMSSIPSKLPAYLFSKKPVIACVENNSDTACAILNANCGWIVPPEDIDQLVRTLRFVCCISRKELLDYGMKGFVYAMENFSRKNNLQKMINLLHQTISREGA